MLPIFAFSAARSSSCVFDFKTIGDTVTVFKTFGVIRFIVEKALRQKAAANPQHFELKENCRQHFQQVRFAATVGARANEWRKALLLLQIPFGAEVMFEPRLQTAKTGGVGDFEAQQLHPV